MIEIEKLLFSTCTNGRRHFYLRVIATTPRHFRDELSRSKTGLEDSAHVAWS